MDLDRSPGTMVRRGVQLSTLAVEKTAEPVPVIPNDLTGSLQAAEPAPVIPNDLTGSCQADISRYLTRTPEWKDLLRRKDALFVEKEWCRGASNVKRHHIVPKTAKNHTGRSIKSSASLSGSYRMRLTVSARRHVIFRQA